MKVSSKDRTLVFDIEANGLLDEVTKIWCLFFIDMDTKEQFLFHDFDGFCNATGEVIENGKTREFTIPKKVGSVEDGVKFAHKAKTLVCHNALGYDLPLMKKFFPKFKIKFTRDRVRDTLLESQVQWYDRPFVWGAKGIHGLDAWGVRLGIKKPAIEDWSTFDIYKLDRCIEDVKINLETAIELEREREMLKERCGIDFSNALEIENEYRYRMSQQEANGALVDVPHMEKCVVTLTKELDKLKSIIEPKLPPTIKYKGAKVTKEEANERIGYEYTSGESTKLVKEEGKVVEKVVKPLYKPTTKWTKESVGKLYSIRDKNTEEVLVDYKFSKLKYARDYAKENFPEVKKFVYPSIEDIIVEYDSHTKTHFGDKLEDITIIGPFTKVSLESSTMSQHDKVKMYLLSLGWEPDSWTNQTDVNDNPILADKDMTYRWPTCGYEDYTATVKVKRGKPIPNTPQVTDKAMEDLDDDVGGDIKMYNTYSHRLKFIKNPKGDEKGLLNNVREDGRITCGIMTFGTTAGRSSHNLWVNPPSGNVVFGKEIREIVIAPENHTLIGIDMPSAHPRILADVGYADNDFFRKAVDGKEEDEETGEYIGEDFHTVNSVLFGLNKQEDVDKARETQDKDLISQLSDGRKKGKGLSYTCIYGGSGFKLAKDMGIPAEEGKIAKDRFLSGLGLDKIIDEVESHWEEMGLKERDPKLTEEDKKYRSWLKNTVRNSYIPVLGGYYVWCSSKHKIVNYKALGSEAVIQKVAIIKLLNEFDRLGLKTKIILNMHDEALFEVPNEELDKARPLIANMYNVAAKSLGLTLDWSSAAKEGKNYYECH